MKKEFISIIFLIMLIIFPIISADMIISQQPDKIYNLGDSISVPITVKTLTGVSGIFSMDLLCGSKIVNFYKNGVKLGVGEEKIMDASLILTKDILGEYTGNCKIKAVLLSEYIITNEFKVSNLLTIVPNTDQKEYA